MDEYDEIDLDGGDSEPDEGPFRCWCGAEGDFDDLFDWDLFDSPCGGSGVLYCYCGGDFCVCHHHGETECPGCEDCDPDDEDGDGYECDDWDQ